LGKIQVLNVGVSDKNVEDVGGVFERFEKIVCNVLVLKFQWLEEGKGLIWWFLCGEKRFRNNVYPGRVSINVDIAIYQYSNI